MKLMYVHEKLAAAMFTMATNHGTLQARLAEACASVALITPTDMPDAETAEMLKHFWTGMTSVPAGANGDSVAATTAKMTDGVARGLALLLADLATRVELAVRHRHDYP